jgi:hypothetical protein
MPKRRMVISSQPKRFGHPCYQAAEFFKPWWRWWWWYTSYETPDDSLQQIRRTHIFIYLWRYQLQREVPGNNSCYRPMEMKSHRVLTFLLFCSTDQVRVIFKWSPNWWTQPSVSPHALQDGTGTDRPFRPSLKTFTSQWPSHRLRGKRGTHEEILRAVNIN